MITVKDKKQGNLFRLGNLFVQKQGRVSLSFSCVLTTNRYLDVYYWFVRWFSTFMPSTSVCTVLVVDEKSLLRKITTRITKTEHKKPIEKNPGTGNCANKICK